MTSMSVSVGQDDDEYSSFFPNPSSLQTECIALYKSKQYRSCEILARMHLAKSLRQSDLQDNCNDRHFAIRILGDCAFGQQQYIHAKQFYKKIYCFNENAYRSKEAQCLKELGSLVEAAAVLEKIPREQRSIQMNMMLGSLYVASYRKEDASKSFLDWLEIVLALRMCAPAVSLVPLKLPSASSTKRNNACSVSSMFLQG